MRCMKLIWRYKLEYDQIAQTYKSDVFTCGIAAFTDIIYLVCTADSLKLCIYSKALRWK